MVRAVWLMGLLVISGCGASVTVRATDVPTTTDVPATTDAPTTDAPTTDAPVVTGECTQPSDCGGTAPSVSWCERSSSWSCIDHQCVWECRGGRRCDRAPDGCVSCDGEMREYCPGRDVCTPGWPGNDRSTDSTCARAWTREPSQCFGPWARMNDGTLCALQSAFTGAPRSVLACRRCQMTLEGFEPHP